TVLTFPSAPPNWSALAVNDPLLTAYPNIANALFTHLTAHVNHILSHNNIHDKHQSTPQAILDNWNHLDAADYCAPGACIHEMFKLMKENGVGETSIERFCDAVKDVVLSSSFDARPLRAGRVCCPLIT